MAALALHARLTPLSTWLTRRQLLGLGYSGGAPLLLGGCALNRFSEQVGKATQPLNERLEAWLQGKGKVPEFRWDQVDPAALLVNSFNGVPRRILRATGCAWMGWCASR